MWNAFYLNSSWHSLPTLLNFQEARPLLSFNTKLFTSHLFSLRIFTLLELRSTVFSHALPSKRTKTSRVLYQPHILDLTSNQSPIPHSSDFLPTATSPYRENRSVIFMASRNLLAVSFKEQQSKRSRNRASHSNPILLALQVIKAPSLPSRSSHWNTALLKYPLRSRHAQRFPNAYTQILTPTFSALLSALLYSPAHLHHSRSLRLNTFFLLFWLSKSPCDSKTLETALSLPTVCFSSTWHPFYVFIAADRIAFILITSKSFKNCRSHAICSMDRLVLILGLFSWSLILIFTMYPITCPCKPVVFLTDHPSDNCRFRPALE